VSFVGDSRREQGRQQERNAPVTHKANRSSPHPHPPWNAPKTKQKLAPRRQALIQALGAGRQARLDWAGLGGTAEQTLIATVARSMQRTAQIHTVNADVCSLQCS